MSKSLEEWAIEADELLASDDETMEETTVKEKLVSDAQAGTLSKTAAEYAKRGFKIKRTPLVLQIASQPGPSMEVSGRDQEERCCQESLALLAKKKIDELTEKLKKSSEVRRQEEKQLEQKPEETDIQYLQRLTDFYSARSKFISKPVPSSSSVPSLRSTSPPGRQRSPRHEDVHKVSCARLADSVAGSHRSRSTERTVVLEKSPVRYSEATGETSSAMSSNRDRRVVVERSPTSEQVQEISANKLHCPLTAVPKYRMDRYKEFPSRSMMNNYLWPTLNKIC